MSKITLAPDVSGTGTFTIAAPNGNTDRTLTLPDTTAPILAGSGITLSASAPANTLVTTDAGNVGIGTSSPGVKLDVNGNIRAQTGSFVGYTGTSGFTLLTTVAGSVTNGGALALRDESATYNTSGMEFYAGGTERMRIDSSGNLLVGTTVSNPVAGRVNGTVILAGGNISNRKSAGWDIGISSSSGPQMNFYTDNGSTFVGAGGISSSGSSTSYVTSSDYRLKHDIAPMTGALAKVAALNPVTYKWNADDSESHGFIAHELQAVVPECVVGEKDAVNEDGSIKPQGIDTSFLVATLTAAIQEQQAIIESLTARVVALEGQS